MQNAISLYTDPNCEREGQIIGAGIAAATGNLGNASNWGRVYWTDSSKSKGDILVLKGNQLAGIGGEITLSGGSAIYDCSIDPMIPYADEVETDTKSNSITTKIYNPFFISHDGENNASYALSIWARDSSVETYKWFDLRIYYYTQTPEDATSNTRETWYYDDGYNNASYLSELLYLYQSPASWDTNMRQVKMYKLALGENEYYMFVFGVSAIGKYNDGSTGLSGGSTFIAIPIDYFKDKEAKPWVGPTGEDDSETGFASTTEIHDVITSRELSEEQRNPFGINSGMGCGLKVVFPNKQRPGGVLTSDNYLNYILGCIYRGEASGLFNKLEQRFSQSFNGNTNRPAEEVSAMISAIVCCHTVPYFTVYESSYTKITSLGGYPLNVADFGLRYWNDNTAEYADYLNKANSLLAPSKTIFDSSHTSSVIPPRLNCFLDYEPYTRMTLQLPFFKPISLSPSMVYDHTITANYRIDIITGFLYVDVFAGNVLITSMSTNVKTDIPIIGQGANGGGLSKIMSSISSLATSSNESQLVSNGITSAFNIADAISTAKFGTVVGKEGNPALAPYCTPRTAYLMITHPRAAIPVSKDGEFNDAVFLNQLGMRANLGYKIKELSGGWNKFSAVNLSQVNAPQYIKDDILSKLREGVYIE